MAKDYYVILGIPANAPQSEVKKAYRQLAQEYHPDHYGPDSKPFREIQEAYSVLGDPASRREYDRRLDVSRERRTRPRRGPGPEPLRSSSGPGHLGRTQTGSSFGSWGSAFDELLDFFWGNFGPPTRRRGGRERAPSVEVSLSPSEARRGGSVRVRIPAPVRCPRCRGRGGVGFYTCAHCGGRGAVTEQVPVTLEYPPGMAQDRAVLVPIRERGGDRSYLRVIFRIEPTA